jgi:arginine-tRNA-protein transferase
MFYHDSIDPEILTGSQLDTLLSLGWYRMHQSVFCTSHIEHDGVAFRVHWLRYFISSLKQQSSHKRIHRKNEKFKFSIEDFNEISNQHAELHFRYRASINFNGALTIQDALFGDHTLERNIFNTKCISVFDEGKLIAAGYFDVGETSAASILHFFDPNYKKYSLGKYLILITLDYLREKGYTFYYPGYVVEGLSKMDYKLFLGRDRAQYFDPAAIAWRKFHNQLLVRQDSALNNVSIPVLPGEANPIVSHDAK